MPSRREAVLGSFVGLAVGDALGFPTEFRRRAQLLQAFGPEGVTDFVRQHDARFSVPPHILGRDHPAGTYSDDTQLSLAVAEALLAAPAHDLDALMTELARRFIAWAHSPENNRAPGSTCLTGCERLEQGLPWREAGVADSKGCGSVMRVAPIALALAHDRAWMLEVARASSLLTHGHPAAVEGCAATALAVALATEGESPERIVQALERECRGRARDLDQAFDRFWAARALPPEEALTHSVLGEGWVAEEALASALYCFARTPDDFRATVLTAVNTDGDSDSIACIAGALSGARLGLGAIPERWRAGVENSARLHAVGEALARLGAG
jgi:ADP-ribosylglycohydrolase